jgi:hypothetical protein
MFGKTITPFLEILKEFARFFFVCIGSTTADPLFSADYVPQSLTRPLAQAKKW